VIVSAEEIREDRYSRLRLIPWWDQAKIAACRVLVIGAGALGNEILKNLALLGFRQVVVVDVDHIEESNLSRTILYRTEDIGSAKAEAAARAYRAIAPDATVQPIDANVVHGCGLGLFAWSDIILAGLDNREARLWINRAAWKVNRPWIDGAIEGINGIARAFLPGQAPCYECTLGEVDWAILDRRMSCNLLAHRKDTEGKIPTTPTISSIIAGIQVQEAVKLLHGLPTLAGKAFMFEGLNHSSYTFAYTENPDCMSHYTLPEIVRLAQASNAMKLHDLWLRAASDLQSQDVVVEFSRDVIEKFVCPACKQEQDVFAAAGSVAYEDGACPHDGERRIVETIHTYTGREAYGGRSLSQLGLPLFDIFVARHGDREIGYLMNGDAAAILGPLATEEIPERAR
jgi:adenylyltransferase/sulfurtransferase